MTRYMIGAGGWGYFQISGMHPLVAYSKAFNFVELNSSFYQIPSLKNAETWRRMVPKDFEFTVRCNKTLTHNLKFQHVSGSFEILEKTINICKALKAEILHFQTPPSFPPSKTNAALIKDFFSSVRLKGIRVALELNAAKQPLSSEFIQIMLDHNIIHCVDLSRDEEPAVHSDILYSRLFGKGSHNIYQPTDQELKDIDSKISKSKPKKAVLGFHFIRMYKDAARFKLFKQSGKFPMVTKSTGIDSLKEVLQEDSRFPSNRKELIQHQGWKIIDLTPHERVHASDLLQKLPKKTYNGIDDITKVLGDQNFE